MTISLYSDFVNGPTNLLASGTVNNVTFASGWIDVFWAPVTVALNTPYYLSLSSTDPSLIVSSTGSDSYADGSAFFGASFFGTLDITFRTYYETNLGQGGGGTGLPVPGALALLGFGLIGLGLRRRAS